MAIEIKSVSYKYTGISGGYPRISVTITTNLSSYYYKLSSNGYSKGSGNATSATYTIEDIGFNNVDTEYQLNIYVDDQQPMSTSANTTITIYTGIKLEDFSWKLNSYTGSDGKIYMNNYNNKPAPVTAEEWNRFCDAASDRGITITRAIQGGSMLAAVQSASNKLDIQLPEGNKVTLQFFTDLAKALNSK